MPASTGKTGRDVTFEVGDSASPEVFTAVANVNSINPSGREADEIDFTHLKSVGGYREFRQGFKDAGQVQLTLQFDPTHATHTNLETLLNSGDVFNWRINFEDAGWDIHMIGQGFVRGSDITITVDDPITADVTIRVTGQITFDDVS